MLNHVRSWLYVGDESRPFVVLDGLLGLYGLMFDSAIAYGQPLYLCAYKLDGSITPSNCMDGHVTWLTLDLEEVPEKIDRWANANERFTKIHKDGYVEHPIWGRWFIVNP